MLRVTAGGVPSAKPVRAGTGLPRSCLLHTPRHCLPYHFRSFPPASCFEERQHGQQRQHRDRPARHDHPVHLIQVGSGHHAAMPDSFHVHQDLDLNVFDHGEGAAGGTHITTIPGCLVPRHGTRQATDQLGSGRIVSKEINVPRFDFQAMERESGAPAHCPPAISNHR